MSFYTSTKKPSLISMNMLNSIKNRIREKNIKQKMLVKKMAEIEKEKMLQNEEKSKTWYKTLYLNTVEFVKENYGFVILVILISILLYIRYIEVSKNKDKIMKIKKRLHETVLSNSDSDSDSESDNDSDDMKYI